jgi:hypothetical protein
MDQKSVCQNRPKQFGVLSSPPLRPTQRTMCGARRAKNITHTQQYLG